MIDLVKAQKVFSDYTKKYNIANGRIRVKIAHTQRVVQNSKIIAEALGLDKEQIELAQLIGLLHDIGRFEQVKRYNTFSDRDSINHGKLGVEILFKDGLIREFIEESNYDEIIKQAILIHNTKKVPENLEKTVDLQARIIRDADKVDIYYTLITEPIQDTYGCDTMENDTIQEELVRQFRQEHYMDYSLRSNGAECLLSHIAYVFDFNYNASLKIIEENDYITKLANRFKFLNPNTDKTIQACAKMAKEYMKERTN